MLTLMYIVDVRSTGRLQFGILGAISLCGIITSMIANRKYQDLVEDHPSIGTLILINSGCHGLILASARMDRKLVTIPLRKYLPLADQDANSNELNAAYAADGYARVKSNSIGVILTT